MVEIFYSSMLSEQAKGTTLSASAQDSLIAKGRELPASARGRCFGYLARTRDHTCSSSSCDRTAQTSCDRSAQRSASHRQYSSSDCVWASVQLLERGSEQGPAGDGRRSRGWLVRAVSSRPSFRGALASASCRDPSFRTVGWTLDLLLDSA